jgi:hypothetical protein
LEFSVNEPVPDGGGLVMELRGELADVEEDIEDEGGGKAGGAE